MQVPATVMISRAAERARATKGEIRRVSSPACSMIAAKLSAPRINQTVVSMLAIPPREKRSSIVLLPLVETKPLAMAL